MTVFSNHLSQPEVRTLLDPVRDFYFCIADLTSLQQIWCLSRSETPDRVLQSFTLGNSMGSGGNLFAGNSSISVGLCTLKAESLPHAIVQPQGVVNRLRQATMSGERIDAPEGWLALSRDLHPLSSGFWTAWERWGAGLSFECAGSWVVVWQDGSTRLDMAHIVSEVVDARLAR